MSSIHYLLVLFCSLMIWSSERTWHSQTLLSSPEQECSTNELMDSLYRAHPEMYHRSLLLERDYQRYAKGKTSDLESAPLYVIPVVVHIVHQNGFEKISDSDVFRAIEWLNEGFANIGYYDQGVGVDTRIQFCLAQRDPNGNATNGIVRVVSPQTNVTNDAVLKNTSRWDPHSYANIWVVNDAGGPGGYATFPSVHGGTSDGIVVKVDKMLSIGSGHSTLIHEFGHYFGLHHVFVGGCVNDDCLSDGDRVCDTPPDGSTVAPPSCTVPVNSCSTDANSGLTSDMDDLTWNYLDYGNYKCRSGYTQGQVDRMHFFIENARSSLLNNLSCVDPCPAPFTASFTTSKDQIMMGEQVEFVNISTGGSDFEWYVNDVSEANTKNFSHTFNGGSGVFVVRMEANTSDPNCQEVFRDTIIVECPARADYVVSTYRTTINNPVQFTDDSRNAADYNWYVNGQLQGVSPDFSFSFTAEGKYKVDLEVFDATGKCSDIKTVYIDVKCVAAIFSMSDTFPVPGSTVLFTDASLSANTISWSVNGVDVGSNPSFSNTFDSSGIYTICLKVTNGMCTDEWCSKLFVFDSLKAECENTFISLLGNSGKDEGQSVITLDNNRIFLASSQDNQIGLTLLDQRGQLQWNRIFNPFPEREHIKDLHYEGNGVVLGVGEADINQRKEAFPFAFKYDLRNNQMLWFRTLEFPGIEHCDLQGININPQTGNYLLNGQIHGGPAYGNNALLMEIDPDDGQQIWSKHYDLGSTETFNETQIFQNKVYNVGRYNFFGGGQRGFRMAVTQLELDGTHNWTRLYVHPTTVAAREYATSFHITPQRMLVCGFGDLRGISTTEVHMILFQADIMGNIQWCKTMEIPDGNSERVLKIMEVTDGFLMSGNFKTNNGDSRIFLLHVDEQGNVLSKKAFGQPGFDTRLFSMEFFDGKIHIIGSTNHMGSGQEDIIIMKLHAFGQVVDEECSIELPLNLIEHDLNNPYDGLHPLTTYNLSAQFDSRPFIPQDQDIEKEDLCYEPCLYDTCHNGAHKDSVSDVWLKEVAAFCNGTGISLSLEICNRGGISILDSLPIAIYGEDPVSTSGHGPLDIFYLKEKLDSGTCRTVHFDFTDYDVSELYIIANDRGFAPTALDLEFFQPNTDILECNFVNNIGHTYLPRTDLDLELGPNDLVCPTFVRELDAGNGFASYQWSTLETTQRITVFNPGTYTVEAQDSCGRTYRDTIEFILDINQNLDLGLDSLQLCPQEPALLRSTGYEKYQWTPRPILDCDTCSEVQLAVDTSQWVWLTATTDLGCILRDSVWVDILSLDTLQQSVSICEGDSLNIAGRVVYDTGIHTLRIENTQGCDTLLLLTVDYKKDTTWIYQYDTICPGQTLGWNDMSIDSAGIYQHISAESSCADMDVLIVVEAATPNYALLSKDITCHGMRDGEILLTLNQLGFNTSIMDMMGIPLADPSSLSAGEYQIKIVDVQHGCVYLDTAIIREPAPVQVVLPPDTMIVCGEGLNITAQIQPDSAELTWMPADLTDCDDCPTIMVKPMSSQWIYASVIDSNGCESMDSMLIEVMLEYNVFIPNVFSPNGDSQNDVWQIYFNKNIDLLRVQVYDRWGELVHDSKATGQWGWDGQFNGVRAQEGVYAYLVEYQERGGGKQLQTGSLTLVR